MRLCRTLVGQAAAFWATLTIWLGTPVIFYSHLAPGYSHAASLFAVGLFLLSLDALARRPDYPARGRPRRRRWADRDDPRAGRPLPDRPGPLRRASGLIGAVAAGRWREITRAIVDVAVIGVAAVVAYIPQLLTYQVLNGVPRPNKDVSDKMNIVSPLLLQVMTDPAHALPYWSPIVLLALAGAVLLIRRNPRLGLALIIGFLLTWYINGAIKTWTTAGSFGARRFLNCTPIFVVGLAYAYEAIFAGGGASRSASGDSLCRSSASWRSPGMRGWSSSSSSPGNG